MKRVPRGFSLVELLIVVAMVAILSVLTITALGSSMRATRLTQGTQQVLDQFHLARQFALTRNRTVETRFYQFTNESDRGWQAMQNFELKEDGTVEPLGRMVRLPEGVLLGASAELSPLLVANRAKIWTATDPQISLPTVGTAYATRKLRFHPDGSTDLPVGGNHWFVTLHSDEKNETLTALPPNFSLIQVNPWTGRPQLYRP